MRLKFLAAAAAIVCSSTSFASINTNDADSELFLIVWDEAKATYVKDLGLTLGSVVSEAAGKSWLFSVEGSANFEAYAKEDGNLFDFTPVEGTRWAIMAVDTNDNFNFDGKDRNLLTTTFDDKPLPADAATVTQTQEGMGFNFVGEQQQNGLGVALVDSKGNPINKDSFNKLGNPAHFVNFLPSSVFIGNAVGKDLAKLSFCSWDLSFVEVPCSTKNAAGLDLTASFDGMNISVSAVPEPGTYAMLLAGLVAVGAFVRRRKG